ncbi:MAG: hypothetical protein WCE73_12170 [Candidatus Angelobacter sp.]
MSRRGWLIFLTVQASGEVCAWTAEHFLSALGPALWIIGTVLLLPGDLAGAFIVENLLWKSPLTATQLTVLQVPVGLAINAVVWLLCVKLYTFLRGRRASLGSAPNAAGSNLSRRSP